MTLFKNSEIQFDSEYEIFSKNICHNAAFFEYYLSALTIAKIKIKSEQCTTMELFFRFEYIYYCFIS